jgi:hypothetical protein
LPLIATLIRYAALLARNSRPDTRVPLGYHHPRAMVLPFAVSGVTNRVRVSVDRDGTAPAGFRAVSAVLEDAYLDTIRAPLATNGAAA